MKKILLITPFGLLLTFFAMAQKPGSGNAISFNGMGNYAQAPHNNNINFSLNDNFSIDFWLKIPSNDQPNTDGPDNMIIEKWENGSPDPFPFTFRYYNQLSPDYGQIRFGRYNGSFGESVISGVAINDNKWHHISGVKSSSSLLFYLDGILMNTSNDISTGSTQNTHNIYFGTRGGLKHYLNASMDEVRIWNTALTQDQIRDRMCHKITITDALYPNLLAYYNFDESTGNVVFDGTMNENNGILINSPVRLPSGAAIGNQSAHNYVATGLPSVNLGFNGQDNLAVSVDEGTYVGEAGTHIYVVNEKPNTQAGITFPGTNNRYFGVFNANIATPQYTAVYNYTDNPAILGNENDLLIFKRNDNAGTIWENANGMLNVTANTFTLTGQNTEYNLGFLANPLPLNLLSFLGKSTEKGNELVWKTTNETNFSHFEIQRSRDAKKFEKIGEKISDESNNYEFSDNLQLVTQNLQLVYYRLKMIDLDGKYSYSKIINVQNEAEFSFTIHPNPVIDQVNITANIKESGNYQIKIMDEIGRVKSSQNRNLKAGQNQISISSNSWPKGLYFAVIQGDIGFIKVLKFVK